VPFLEEKSRTKLTIFHSVWKIPYDSVYQILCNEESIFEALVAAKDEKGKIN
jgi:hypothetical protein